jgi:hypothetical protein
MNPLGVLPAAFAVVVAILQLLPTFLEEQHPDQRSGWRQCDAGRAFYFSGNEIAFIRGNFC